VTLAVFNHVTEKEDEVVWRQVPQYSAVLFFQYSKPSAPPHDWYETST